MSEHKTIIIGIAGPSASGKSLLARTIVEEISSEQVTIIAEDSYYRDRSHQAFDEREKVNYDHPDALDHNLLAEHLETLQRGEHIHVPTYDYSEHIRLKETREIGRHSITVLEGILLFVDNTLCKISSWQSPDNCKA